MDTFSYYKVVPNEKDLGIISEKDKLDILDFDLLIKDALIDDVIERKGFIFVVDAEQRCITETRSGARIVTEQGENSKQPFSQYVLKVIQFLDSKSWEEINYQISRASFAYRDAYLNILI